jgi:hypothetical protein
LEADLLVEVADQAAARQVVDVRVGAALVPPQGPVRVARCDRLEVSGRSILEQRCHLRAKLVIEVRVARVQVGGAMHDGKAFVKVKQHAALGHVPVEQLVHLVLAGHHGGLFGRRLGSVGQEEGAVRAAVLVEVDLDRVAADHNVVRSAAHGANRIDGAPAARRHGMVIVDVTDIPLPRPT